MNPKFCWLIELFRNVHNIIVKRYCYQLSLPSSLSSELRRSSYFKYKKRWKVESFLKNKKPYRFSIIAENYLFMHRMHALESLKQKIKEWSKPEIYFLYTHWRFSSYYGFLIFRIKKKRKKTIVVERIAKSCQEDRLICKLSLISSSFNSSPPNVFNEIFRIKMNLIMMNLWLLQR